MKITITNYGTTYSVETKNDDVNAFEAFEYAMNLLKQVYHPDNIDDAICGKADEINSENLTDFLAEEPETPPESEYPVIQTPNTQWAGPDVLCENTSGETTDEPVIKPSVEIKNNTSDGRTYHLTILKKGGLISQLISQYEVDREVYEYVRQMENYIRDPKNSDFLELYNSVKPKETTDALQDCIREGEANLETSNILCKQDNSNII